MKKAILFDLDGTLLPMDLDEFLTAYFQKISQWLVPLGYEPKQMVDTIWRGTGAMIKNDGSVTNENVFWKTIKSVYGEDILKTQEDFATFYIDEFPKLQSICGYQPLAAEIIHSLQEKGYLVILATNPFFPQAATYWRVHWAGLAPEDFNYISTYENSCSCKPNLNYYLDILQKYHLKPEECLMVGNDVTEDMVAKELGIDVFLLTDNLLNKSNKDISQYPNGDFYALRDLLSQLPKLN